jgi:nicotinamidase-related amidase
MIELDPRISALVLIDLQKGILSNALTPVTSQDLLVRGQALAERFRAAKATVVLVNVAFSRTAPTCCANRWTSHRRSRRVASRPAGTNSHPA